VRQWCLMRERMGANGYREVGKWLRGVDLNHRPLGYERKRLTVTQAERFGRVNFHSNVISTGL